jgi:hypothetical protein
MHRARQVVRGPHGVELQSGRKLGGLTHGGSFLGSSPAGSSGSRKERASATRREA